LGKIILFKDWKCKDSDDVVVVVIVPGKRVIRERRRNQLNQKR
jgi:hypothetical protein